MSRKKKENEKQGDNGEWKEYNEHLIKRGGG
jgi:hypothetical protein